MKLFNKTVTINELIPYTILFVYAIVLASLMIYWGNWTVGDDAIYLRTTALGQFGGCFDGIRPDIGRFFPLAHFDYNLTLLLPFLPAAKAHYLLNAVSFCAYVFLLWWLIKKVVYSVEFAREKSKDDNIRNPFAIFFILVAIVFSKKLLLVALVLYGLLQLCSRWFKEIDFRPWVVALAVFSILLQPMWSVDFFELHSGARLAVVLMVLFMWAMYKFIENQRWIYALIALFVTSYLTYSSEYHFGLFVVFASTMLLFYPHQTKSFKVVMWCVMAIALSFLCVYLCFIFPHMETMYSHGERNLILGTKNLLSWVKVYGVAIPIALYRLYAVLWKKDRNNIFLDSCLATGIAGCCALIVLGICESYAHIIDIVLCYVPVVYWVQKFFSSKCSLILNILLIIGLYNPFISTLNARADEMQETMPKVEQVLTMIDEGTQLSIIVPYNPEEIIPDAPRDEYELFVERFESILIFAEPSHTDLHINKCAIENVISGSDDILYIAKTDDLENMVVQEAISRKDKQIGFGEFIVF